jgi:hypothetical protein
MKIKTYSTLLNMEHYGPEHEARLIEAVFEQTGIDKVFAVITRVPDGVIGSAHITPYRIH